MLALKPEDLGTVPGWIQPVVSRGSGLSGFVIRISASCYVANAGYAAIHVLTGPPSLFNQCTRLRMSFVGDFTGIGGLLEDHKITGRA